jgi:hypothetical protein
MKTRIITTILFVTLLLEGCSTSNNTKVPQKATEIQPGIYMGNDSAGFPFPTSGYSVYIVGETHGNHETKLVFRAFLENLHRKAGLRDVILEEDQAYEPEANAYVLGQTDVLSDELCLRADLLGQIREFNAALPERKKVHVHLVDVDSPLRTIHKHLTDLHAQLGTKADSISIPALAEVDRKGPNFLYGLIDKLKEVSADQPDVLNELETIHLSVRWYYLGNRLEAGWPTGNRRNFTPVREDIMTKNINYLLSELNGKPVLAFFGTGHGMKAEGLVYPPVPGFKAWAQRLVEGNVKVYSIGIFGESGSGYWHGKPIPNDSEYIGQLTSSDGNYIVSLFDTHPDFKIIYTDYRVEENKDLRLYSDFLDIPASQMYDGLIIFKKFTPMENVCPQ